MTIRTLGDVRREIGLNQETRRQLPHDAGMLNLDALTRGGKRSRVDESGLLYQTLVVVAGVDEHVAVDAQGGYTEQRAGCSLHVPLFRRLEHRSWMWRETEELHRVADEYGPRPARVLCSVSSQGFVHFGYDGSLRQRKSGGRGVLRCRGRGDCWSCRGDGYSGRYGRRDGSRTWCAGGSFSCSGGGLVATTIDGATLGLAFPFVVIATQNPIEQEGTYPLPEAQLDRFLLKLSTGYPANRDLENEILLRRIQWQKDDSTSDLKPAVDMDRFVELQQRVETEVYTDQVIVDYITQLVRLSREHPRVAMGVSPRGALALLRASRSIALIHGRDFVVPDDVKMVVPDVLSHRIILNIEDTLEGVRGEMIIDEVLQQVPVPSEIGREAS